MELPYTRLYVNVASMSSSEYTPTPLLNAMMLFVTTGVVRRHWARPAP